MRVPSIKFGFGLLTTTIGAIVLAASAIAQTPTPIVVPSPEPTSEPGGTMPPPTTPELTPGSTQPTPQPTSSPTPTEPQSAPTAPATPAPSIPSPVVNGVRIEIAPASNSQVPADGRSSVQLAGQIVDANGTPVNEDVLVTLTSSAGKFLGADQDTDRPGFQVMARSGKFTAELQSTLEPKKVKVRAAIDPKKQEDGLSSVPYPAPSTLPKQWGLNGLEAYTQVDFITNLRPPLVSGVVNLRIGKAGTDFYAPFREFLQDTDGYRVDFYSAVFATGKVGDWLFTGAFNNSRPLNQQCDGSTRLFRDSQFCDQAYPVYGDSSTVDYLTPSTDSVYAKLEKTSRFGGQDYFMWGDYKTEEFSAASQYYTATARQLHGFKANYNFGPLQATFAYGNNLDGFQRDTLVANGTSGLYFLSRRLVVGGSESVYLETEELNRPGSVVERTALSRIKDYEIDYDRGTLIFRRPIQSTDLDLFGRTLVRRIVVTYQYDSVGGGDNKLYAGRLQYNLSKEFGRESFVGGTYLREDQGLRDFELYGADLLFSFGKSGQVVAEMARSSNQNLFADPFSTDPLRTTGRQFVEGNAYRVEARTSLSEALRARAYYRSVDENFSNTATFSFTPGQTRYGAEFSAQVAPNTLFKAQVDREINFGTASYVLTGTSLFDTEVEPLPGTRVDNSLTTISAGLEQKLGKASLSLDWVKRNRDDRATDNLDEDSNQIVSRLAIPLTEKLLFRAQNETNFGGEDPLYPNRTTFGLDWKLNPGVTVRLAQQFYGSTSQFKGNSITSLDTIVDHKLSDDTSLTGRYSVLGGASGMTGQGAIGLNHRIKLSPGLRVNLGYERIFGDIFGYAAAGQRYAQPYAVGQSASSLGVSSGDSYNVGIDYTDSPSFKASARFERRNSDIGDNTVWSIAAAGKLTPAFTVLARFQQANASNQLLTGLGDYKSFKLGVAYRDPNNDKLNLLAKYEFRQNPGFTSDSLLFGDLTNGEKVHIASLEALYSPNFRWEFYGKYAMRSTQSAAGLEGTNFISLGQLRSTYRLGFNWDLGGEVRWTSQSVTGFDELGFLLEAGYYLTPNLRLAAGYSFGDVNNDRDFDGSRSRGGFYATVSLKLNELFGGFGLQRVSPPQQREAQKEVVTQADPSTQSQAQPATITQSQLPTLNNISAEGEQR
jgi:hypothetical protein